MKPKEKSPQHSPCPRLPLMVGSPRYRRRRLWAVGPEPAAPGSPGAGLVLQPDPQSLQSPCPGSKPDVLAHFPSQPQPHCPSRPEPSHFLVIRYPQVGPNLQKCAPLRCSPRSLWEPMGRNHVAQSSRDRGLRSPLPAAVAEGPWELVVLWVASPPHTHTHTLPSMTLLGLPPRPGEYALCSIRFPQLS